MEEFNEVEVKTEDKHKHEHGHGHCSRHSKGHGACCSGHGGLHIFIKFIVIFVVFLIGVCIGSHASRYSDESNYGGNYHRQGGCAMMEGNFNHSACNHAGMGMVSGQPMMGSMNAGTYYQNASPAEIKGCPMMTGVNSGDVISATVISKPVVSTTTIK